MNKLIKEIIGLFIIVVFANIVAEIGEAEKMYLIKPFKFFVVALGVSIVGGLITYWFKNRQPK